MRLRKAWPGLALARAPGSRDLSGASRPVLPTCRRSQRSPRPRPPPAPASVAFLKGQVLRTRGRGLELRTRAGLSRSCVKSTRFDIRAIGPRGSAEILRRRTLPDLVILGAPPSWPHALPFRARRAVRSSRDSRLPPGPRELVRRDLGLRAKEVVFFLGITRVCCCVFLCVFFFHLPRC